MAQSLADAYADGDVEEMLAIRDSQCPTGKMGDAWDVAYAALFLASDEAKYITGTQLGRGRWTDLQERLKWRRPG